MGKSPIPKMDYVMYFIRWVTLRAGILPEVSILSIYLCVIPVEAYTGRVGVGRTISKGTLHSLEIEDRQDFVIRCRTYSNSKISDGESVYQYRFHPRSLIELLIQ